MRPKRHRNNRSFHPGPGALALALLLATGSHADGLERTEGVFWDWVPVESLPEAKRQALPAGCSGAYISPVRTDADAQAEPDQSPTRGFADRSQLKDKNRVTLEGDVYLTQGYLSLEAQSASFDKQTRMAEVDGEVAIREPGMLLRGRDARMNTDSREAELDEASFVLHEDRMRGSAEHLSKFGDNVINLQQAAMTTCEPGNKAWVLTGKNVSLYSEENYGTARNVWLKLYDLPVLYTPYIRFPLGDERETGFLFPTFGRSGNKGTQVRLPFYWNIAPNLDMTIAANYMSKRGTSWEAEGRHLSRHFETRISGAFLADDSGPASERAQREFEQGLISEEEAFPNLGKNRWQFQAEQEGGAGQRWSTEIDYTDLSDDDYLRDIDSSSLETNRTALVSKTGRASYQADHWLFDAKVEELRSLSTAKWPHRDLPRLGADGRYQWGDWRLDLRNEYTYFDVNSNFKDDDPEAADRLLTGQRLRTDYRLTWDKDWMWGFFKPSGILKTLNYELDGDNLAMDANSSPSLTVPQATLDMGLYFERDTGLFGNSFLQTFEPRLFYFFSDFEDHSDLFGLTENNRPLNFDAKSLRFTFQQLYRTERFSGGDRIGDANQLSVGLTSRLIDPLTGQENLSLSLGQIFFFSNRRVGLNSPDIQADFFENPMSEEPEELFDRSDIVGQFSARLGRTLSLDGDIAYSDFDDRLSEASASLRYKDKRERIFNIAYRFTHRPSAPGRLNPQETLDRSLDQIDVTFHYPVTDQWSLVGRSNYDFTFDTELDTFLGIEYDSCCYRVQLLARRWLDFDFTPTFLEGVSNNDFEEAIMIDLQFKGLGSISREITDLLDKAIPGYSSRRRFN